MAVSMVDTVRVLAERAGDDSNLAETLRYLADVTTESDDPFGRPPEPARRAARGVDEQRQVERARARRADALDTAAVIQVLASVNDRRGVDRRRRRGQLLGWRSGAQTLHPVWQFDLPRGETRPGLARVIAALREVTHDDQAADELMRAPREELDHRSLADLLAGGQVETAIRLILASSDQS